MARYSCPSCGMPYNGRKCRHCSYEHFMEETAHGSHTHTGEPLVIDAPARKPIRKKDPFACEKRTRKKHPLAGFLILLAILNTLLPLIRDWGLELEARENSHVAAEPEIRIPENAMVLYQDDDILVAAGWQQGQEFSGDFPVYVRNDSKDPIFVSAYDIQVNGYLLEHSYLHCSAEAGSTAMEGFLLQEWDRVNTGISRSAVQEIRFRLDIFNGEDYETIAETPVISFTTAAAEHDILPPEPGGEVIYDEGGIRVRFLGYAYAPSAYDPYRFEDGAMLFHMENDTPRNLSFSIDEAALNGSEEELYLWCDLPPGSKAVSSVYLYDLDGKTYTSVEDLGEFTFRLEIDDWEDYDFQIRTEPIRVTVSERKEASEP